MKLADLPVEELERALAGDGLGLDFGAMRVRLRTRVRELAGVVRTVYGAYPAADPGGFYDITARVAPIGGVRRLVRPQVNLWVDGESPFEPFPADTHFPLLEWGVNWAFATRSNHCLLLHAGVVERGGRAVVLPALPASGKSTLTAALSTRGFRLLSDEFAVVRLADTALLPIPRAVALKNESIEIIRAFAPDAVLGPEFPEDAQGNGGPSRAVRGERRGARSAGGARARRVPDVYARRVRPSWRRFRRRGRSPSSR